MGIKNLNKFLKQNAKQSINLIQLNELSGKKIAVDISIYMYRYMAENALIENMYLMLSIFKHCNIIPVFVFDGKPPSEKSELLQKRKEDKQLAEEEYNELKRQLDKTNDEDDKQELLTNMDTLKKKFITITKEDTEKVKEMIRSFGATYFDAKGEADELCAFLTIKNKVWACLSEDMDMFAYGCSRIIRYISLLNRSAVVYYMDGILSELGITQTEFREICVLSGTDYNSRNMNSQNRLSITLKYFKKYHKHKKNNTFRKSFTEWLLINHKSYITDYTLLTKIYDMFDLNNISAHPHLERYGKIQIFNGPSQYDSLTALLKQDGFLFV